MTTEKEVKKEEKILKNNSEKSMLLNDILIEKSEDFLEYINANDMFLEFSELLTLFLKEYFIGIVFKPLIIKLMMFIFSGEDYSEPMIKIKYPDKDDFDNLKIKDDIEEKFKIFLVNKSKDVNEFQIYRKIQRQFRFVIRRE